MSEPTSQREKRELGQLLWFFWAGIGCVTVAESIFVVLMKGGGQPTTLSATSLGHLAGFAVVLLGMITAANVTRFAGDGLAVGRIMPRRSSRYRSVAPTRSGRPA